MTLGKTHITAAELSKRWGVHANTLQRWRTEGGGPKFVRLGMKRILYPLAEVEAHENFTRKSTSESSTAQNLPPRDPTKKALNPKLS